MNIHCYAKPQAAFPFIQCNEMRAAASLALKQLVEAWKHGLPFARLSSGSHMGIPKSPGEPLKK